MANLDLNRWLREGKFPLAQISNANKFQYDDAYWSKIINALPTGFQDHMKSTKLAAATKRAQGLENGIEYVEAIANSLVQLSDIQVDRELRDCLEGAATYLVYGASKHTGKNFSSGDRKAREIYLRKLKAITKLRDTLEEENNYFSTQIVVVKRLSGADEKFRLDLHRLLQLIEIDTRVMIDHHTRLISTKKKANNPHIDRYFDTVLGLWKDVGGKIKSADVNDHRSNKCLKFLSLVASPVNRIYVELRLSDAQLNGVIVKAQKGGLGAQTSVPK